MENTLELSAGRYLTENKTAGLADKLLLLTGRITESLKDKGYLLGATLFSRLDQTNGLSFGVFTSIGLVGGALTGLAVALINNYRIHKETPGVQNPDTSSIFIEGALVGGILGLVVDILLFGRPK